MSERIKLFAVPRMHKDQKEPYIVTIKLTEGTMENKFVNCPYCGSKRGGCEHCNEHGVASMPAMYGRPYECPFCGITYEQSDENRTKYRCGTELGRIWETQAIPDVWAGECYGIVFRYAELQYRIRELQSRIQELEQQQSTLSTENKKFRTTLQGIANSCCEETCECGHYQNNTPTCLAILEAKESLGQGTVKDAIVTLFNDKAACDARNGEG